jgi:transcriptional regulator with XRE-family HTH domain
MRKTEPKTTYRDDLIRGEMAAQKLTVADVAEQSGLSSFTVSAIRNGNGNVTLPSLQKVAGVLKIEMQRLFEPRVEQAGTTGGRAA